MNNNTPTPELLSKLNYITESHDQDEIGFCKHSIEETNINLESMNFYLQNNEFNRAETEANRVIELKLVASIIYLFQETFKNFKKIKKNKGKVVLDLEKVPCNKKRIEFGIENRIESALKEAMGVIAEAVIGEIGVKIKSVKIVSENSKIKLTPIYS